MIQQTLDKVAGRLRAVMISNNIQLSDFEQNKILLHIAVYVLVIYLYNNRTWPVWPIDSLSILSQLEYLLCQRKQKELCSIDSQKNCSLRHI